MQLLDSYKTEDKVEVLISDALKYNRNYCMWKSNVLEFYEKECVSKFYYEHQIKLKDEISIGV